MKEIWYTARNTFDPDYHVAFSWEKYIEWSKLFHLKELVSLDSMLNEVAFEPERETEEDWNFIITDESYETGFFTSLEYVLEHTTDKKKYNLIAATKEPDKNKRENLSDEFEFLGYDLLDKDYSISALTNCGGFDETFKPSDLNEYGLVTDYSRARQIQKDLVKNNPEEYHADCYLFEIWRHKEIGRKKKN